MTDPRPEDTTLDRTPSRKRTREIHLGIDHDDTQDLWRVTAECADELTTMIFMGAASIALLPSEDDLAGDYGRRLIEDHGARCASCQKWAAA